MGKEHEIHEMMAHMVWGAIDRGGPHYREFMGRILKHAYHEVKKLGEELVDDDENKP